MEQLVDVEAGTEAEGAERGLIFRVLVLFLFSFEGLFVGWGERSAR